MHVSLLGMTQAHPQHLVCVKISVTEKSVMGAEMSPAGMAEHQRLKLPTSVIKPKSAAP